MQGKRYKPGAEADAMLQNRGAGGQQQRLNSAQGNLAPVPGGNGLPR